MYHITSLVLRYECSIQDGGQMIFFEYIHKLAFKDVYRAVYIKYLTHLIFYLESDWNRCDRYLIRQVQKFKKTVKSNPPGFF